MFDLELVASGLAIGLAVAAPIGPVNLIVIKRALRHGALFGFLTGLGAAIGDAIFATIAAFSLTAVIDLVMEFSTILQIIGGVFLLTLGLKTFVAHPHLQEAPTDTAYSLIGAGIQTFFLTITNPATMLGFLAIFGGVTGLTVTHEDYASAGMLVGAVFLGSVLWWFVIALFASFFRHKMSDRILEIVNHASGVIIALFGVAVLGRLLLKYFW